MVPKRGFSSKWTGAALHGCVQYVHLRSGSNRSTAVWAAWVTARSHQVLHGRMVRMDNRCVAHIAVPQCALLRVAVHHPAVRQVAVRQPTMRLFSTRHPAIRLLAIRLLAIRLLAIRLLAMRLFAMRLFAMRLFAMRLFAMRLFAMRLFAMRLLAMRLLAMLTYLASTSGWPRVVHGPFRIFAYIYALVPTRS